MTTSSETKELKFNYIEQEYYDLKDNIVEVDFDNFPCSRCKSPSELSSTAQSFEVYVCLNCEHTFQVS